MKAFIYLDTNLFIIMFERDDRTSKDGWAVLDAINHDQVTGVTSELAIAELLPKPIATADEGLEHAYIELFASALLFAVPVSRPILLSAARLRASDKSLKLPDAIHVATALSTYCGCVLTEDLRINSPDELTRVTLTPSILPDRMRANT
jgi:predicted nucleic acid-binding protein